MQLKKIKTMGMIKDLFEVGKEIYFHREKLREQKSEKLQLLLLHIGEILKDTYAKLANLTYPAGNCEQLNIFSIQLYEQIKEAVTYDVARTLSDKLKQAHAVEKLYSELLTIDKKELDLLDEAAGYFIATAKLLK